MTIKMAKASVKDLGFVLSRNVAFDEFVVRPTVGTRAEREAAAYFTNDLFDAVLTARQMAAEQVLRSAVANSN